MFARTALITLAALLIGALPAPGRTAEPASLLRDFPRAQLIIDTSGSGCVMFRVYVAQTREHRSQGLMYVTSMDEDEGMIFLYAEVREVAMWMKNTIIPLDMLFVGADRRIAAIHEGAVPYSEAIIEPGVAAAAVIELNAGAVRRFHIEPGDAIIYPAG